jgi:hypothetical protein
MKLYLSGPMSGIDKFNAPAFEQAAAALRRQRYEVVSPVEQDAADGIDTANLSGDIKDLSVTWGDLMARDIKLIADGDFDGIVLLPGWEKSKGARLELALMLVLMKEVYLYERATTNWVSRPDAISMLEVAL